MQEKIEINFGLLENGFDFLISALEYIRKSPKSKSDLKYAILHLCAGTEIILKERLRREHWSLLFENINRANMSEFELGNFTSVSFRTCIERLEGICNIKFSDREKRYLFALREKRNRLEHFGIVDTKEALIGSATRVLSTLLNFINNHLSPHDFSQTGGDLLRSFRNKLGAFRGFVTKRLKQIGDDLEQAKNESFVVQCPACYQDTFVLGEHPSCLFCGYSEEPEVAAKDWVESILGISEESIVRDGVEMPICMCPECQNMSVVHIGSFSDQIDDNQYVCFACCIGWKEKDIDNCLKCGTLYVRGDDDCSICSDCIEYQLSKKE